MKILIAGDFVPCHRVATQIEAGDYSSLDEVSLIIQSANYAIVNFESPVVRRETKPIVKTGPNLKCTAKAIECVANAGFNCITLANNHFRDYGQVGVEDTIDACRKNKVDYVGGGRNKHEAVQTLFRTDESHTLAIVNVCENEWSIAEEDHGGSNPLNPVKNYYAIKEAKSNADFVLVIVHGGIEGYQYPTPRMQETYRFFVDAGADAVINHHQHCFSGYEIYNEKPIFYGLGNFCFDKYPVKNNSLWERGYLVELELSEKIGFRLYPYIQCNKDTPAVKLLEDTKEFNSSIEKLNAVIADDKELKDHFAGMASKAYNISRSLQIPYSSKIAKWVQSKGFLPSFINEYRSRQLLGQIQCESHRDVLLLGLSGIIKH